MRRTLNDIEGYLHGVPIIFTVISAVAGIPLQLYNPIKVGIGCWVESYPINCMRNDDVACIRGKHADSLLWMWGGVEMVFSSVTVTVCMVLVWWRARSQLREIMDKQTEEMKKKTCDSKLEEQAVVGTAGEVKSLEKMRKSVRFTSQQALLYASSFLFTYTVLLLLRGYEKHNSLSPDGFFVLTMFSQLLYPSQGWMICWIYFRPRVKAVREANPDLSLLGIFYETIVGKQ